MKPDLETPFTEDQCCFLEHHLTSLMMGYAAEERIHRSHKEKVAEILQAVKAASAHPCKGDKGHENIP